MADFDDPNFFKTATDDGEEDREAYSRRKAGGGQEKPNGHDRGGTADFPVDVGEDEPIPPRQWLLGTTFCRGFLSSLLSPGGTGKTALRIAQALALATGRPLTGECVHHRARTLYVTLEDSLDELRRRVRAARIHHSVSPDELIGWLFLWAPSRNSKIAELAVGNGIVPGALETQLRPLIVEKRIDLVIIDPFIKAYGGNIDENSNSQIDAVADILVRLSIELNFAPDVLHHDAKGTREAGDGNRGRGASSLHDAGRLGCTLTVMTPEEAKAFGVPENDRRTFVRLDPAKVNLIPAVEARWFQLIGVKIDNGTDDYPNGDVVQTVNQWTPPDTWADLSRAALNDALTAIDAGLPNGQRYSAASAAKARAVWPVVKRYCPDKTDVQCREIIAAWLESGLLFEVPYDDPIGRREMKGLRVDDAKRPS